MARPRSGHRPGPGTTRANRWQSLLLRRVGAESCRSRRIGGSARGSSRGRRPTARRPRRRGDSGASRRRCRGPSFTLQLLEAMPAAAGEPAPILDVLDDAVDHHLVVEEPDVAGGGFAFAHALVRETLYRELSSARRARLHGEVVMLSSRCTATPMHGCRRSLITRSRRPVLVMSKPQLNTQCAAAYIVFNRQRTRKQSRRPSGPSKHST